MKIPKMKTTLKRSRRKARSHLPSLPQANRDLFQMRMEADSRLSPQVVRSVMASFNAAANPSAESPAVVIESLESDEKQIVKQSMPAYSQIFSGVGSRGRNALMMDIELDEMISREADE